MISSIIEWVKKVLVHNTHPIPPGLQIQQREHLDTIHKAVLAVEKLDKSHGKAGVALRELRQLEQAARRR